MIEQAARAIQKRYGGNAYVVESSPTRLEYTLPAWPAALRRTLTELRGIGVAVRVQDSSEGVRLVIWATEGRP